MPGFASLRQFAHCKKYVAAPIAVLRVEIRGVCSIEKLERIVKLLLVEHDARQADARDMLEFLVAAAVHHPLQLGAGCSKVIGVE